MSKDNVLLSEPVSSYVLALIFKSYTEQQQLDFMEQLVLTNNSFINNLLVYVKDKSAYYHPELNFKIGDYIQVNIDFSWSSSDLQYYTDNKLIRDKHILVKVIKLILIDTDKVVILLKTKNGYIKKDILTSYVKKLDLF